MIKPDAMKRGYAGGILDMMINGGFRVVALKQLRLTAEKAGEFYAVHKERPFFGELVEFMSSGPIIAAILEKENAVADFRKLIGATNRLMRKKEPFEKNMQHQLVKMQCMEATVMKMQKLKVIFSSQRLKDFDRS
jgi:nucleoside diphosphate kinase